MMFKAMVMSGLLLLSGCHTMTAQQQLQAQCEQVHASSLREQMGCKHDTDVRAELYLQCQQTCNGGVDRDTVERCLMRCDEFLEKQK